MRNKLTGLLMATLVTSIITLVIFPQYATGAHSLFGGENLLVVEKAEMDSTTRSNLLLRIQLWYDLEVGDTIEVLENDSVAPIISAGYNNDPNSSLWEKVSYRESYGSLCEIRVGGKLVLVDIEPLFRSRSYKYIPSQQPPLPEECDSWKVLSVLTHEPPLWFSRY